jgi:AraC family transcriptional activator of pobA
MRSITSDSRRIDMLRDLPDMIPVFREFYESWTVRVFDREVHECRNYLSPNRRDFYKILLITKGVGVFTTGLHTYYIDQPAILFIHPADIISWKNLTPGEAGGHYILFRKSFVHEHAGFKETLARYGLFTDKGKSVIRLDDTGAAVLSDLFKRMKTEELAAGDYNEHAILAYLQLLLVECMRATDYAEPGGVSDDYHHIHRFFGLLEESMQSIDHNQAVQLKTVKEFAASLGLHPNYLNALLKKHTGENASAHLKSRLLEEAKVLLVHTEWSLQDIGECMGFAEQSNFSLFFKKGTGITPAVFRKQSR